MLLFIPSKFGKNNIANANNCQLQKCDVYNNLSGILMLNFPLRVFSRIQARSRLLAPGHFVNFINVIYPGRGKLGRSCHRLIVGEFPTHIVCGGDGLVGCAFTRFPFE
ncbi:MAG: hypothetical protein D9N14_20565 [Ketobacter sp.]|nr:MAG: hypothetical protein D9N14_20565 [Ketobacter sp.]